MTEIHALFWLGSRSGTSRAYEALYERAANNLDHGAGYLTGRPLGVSFAAPWPGSACRPNRCRRGRPATCNR